MEKVLVEVDIHAGLLETLDIEWRGHLFIQRLDYLGLPFRCSIYRRTRHLRKDCTQTFGAPSEEDPSEDNMVDNYTPLRDQQDLGVYSGLRTEESPEPTDTTFIGKLKLFCPMLYNSLSAWERDHLDSYFLSDSDHQTEVGKIPVLDSDHLTPVFSAIRPVTSLEPLLYKF
jgi:hypothetical protein